MVCDDRLLQGRDLYRCCSRGSRTPTHADSYAESYLYSNRNANGYSHSHKHADSYAYCDSNSYCDRDCYRHRNCDCYRHRNCDCYRHRKCYPNCYPAPQPDTKDWPLTAAATNVATATMIPDR